MFSLNALDPKLVWHIEKETKEGLGAWEKREEAQMDREKLRVREGEHRDSEKDTGKEVETQRKRQGKPKPKPKNPHQTQRKIRFESK